MPNRKINDMYDNIVVHFHMFAKCGNFQWSVIMHTDALFNCVCLQIQVLNVYKMHSKIFNYFSNTFQLFFFHVKRLKRCVIMMYSLYTRLKWACVYTLIKYIIKFKVFVQKETLARALVKI